MCLIINSAIHKRYFGKYIPIKIKKELLVYKCVRFTGDETSAGLVTSPMLKFTYLIGKEYYTKFSIKGKNNDEVHEGFHSYTNKSIAKNNFLLNRIMGCNGIATCVIPKGSKIFLSDFREVVSDKIKIVKVEKL